MSSDELQIDPDLDKEERQDGLTGDIIPARSLTSFFAISNASAGSSSAQNVITKNKAPRRPKAAATDIKQTRLGAGLKPVRLQIEPQVAESSEFAVGNDTLALAQSSAEEKPRKSRKRQDEEGQEMREMAKSARGNAASKRGLLNKGNRGRRELIEEMDTEPVTEADGESSNQPKGRRPSKRKSTTAYPPQSISSNSIENAIHIPDSPDQALVTRKPSAKRRKLEQEGDPGAAVIDVDTSFERDEGIEIVEILKPRGAGAGKVDKQSHPFFGGKPRLVNSNSVKPRPDVGHTDLDNATGAAAAAVAPISNTKQVKTSAHDSPAFPYAKGGLNFQSMPANESTGIPLGSGNKPITIGRAGWGKGEKESKICSTRFPTAEEQHVQPHPAYGSSSPKRNHALLLDLPKRRRTRSQTGTRDDSEFWRKIYPKESERTVRESAKVHDSPQSTARGVHVQDTLWSESPAVQALQSKAGNAHTSEARLWVDKYKPLTAAEVLGNQIPAEYLVSWLKELALGKEVKHVPGGSERPNSDLTPKKRKILTKVKRTRKKKAREDNWIVDDSLDPIGEYLSADGTDTTGSMTDDEHGLENNMSSGTSVYPNFQIRLANSILIQGPHGSGKTAAVHAAAAELGWEIFEVNPGSKRSGAQLSAMVGEVGKNHMVGRSGHAGREATLMDSSQPERRSSLNPVKRNTLAATFGRANGASASRASSSDRTRGNPFMDSPFLDEEYDRFAKGGTEDSDQREATSVGGNFGFIAKNHVDNTHSTDVRQSLILVEEVDILYEEDQGFWPQIVELIATSKRPVIMTCNDLGLIPFERLPLQCTLLFSPPDPAALRPYLRTIGTLENAHVTDAYLSGLMSAATFNHPSGLLLQQPLTPVSLREAKGTDMRMAIMQLQLDTGCSEKNILETLRRCSQPLQRQESEEARLGWHQTKLASEARSYADAYLSLGCDMIADVVDVDRFQPSADDEEGILLLRKAPLSAEVPVLSGSNWTSDIAQMLWELSGNITSIEQEEQDVVYNLALRRENYQLSTLPFLDPIIPLEAPLLPSPVLFTSYIPAISSMVDIDDRLEREDALDAAQGRPRRNRKSGRMMRLTATTVSVPSYVRQLVASDDMGEVGLKAVRDSRLDFGSFEDHAGDHQIKQPNAVDVAAES